MTRVVFSIVEMPGPNGVRLGIQLKEPPELPRPQPEPLGLEAADQIFQALRGVPGQGAVREAGRVLFDALIRNPPLAKQISAALLVQPPERRPVCVELATTDGENFPWEALCSAEGQFLGLDERWAVGRIVETVIPVDGYRHFAPPLRIAAILSCLGVPAADEWAALLAAVEASTVPVELLALVSEDVLHATISAAAPDGVTVEFVPSTVAAMQSRLQEFNAHVLHLFCHGLSTETSPHLQVATRADWLTGEASSLMVESGDIGAFNPPADSLPWLVVLNSCETASATSREAAGSVALNLVYTEGIPAVVGMREPVRSDDATRFTEAFYGQLLPEFASLLTTPGVPGPIDWARLLVGAREQLAERYEPLVAQRGTTKAWTLPVVYTRPSVFTVQTGGATVLDTRPPATREPTATPSAPPAAPPTGRTGGTDHEGTDHEGTATESASTESTRALVLSVEALTGLRAQVVGTGDHQLVSYIDEDLRRLIAELETR